MTRSVYIGIFILLALASCYRNIHNKRIKLEGNEVKLAASDLDSTGYFPITDSVITEPEYNVSSTGSYEMAFTFINNMLHENYLLNFRDAVFVVENAYCNDTLNYMAYLNSIRQVFSYCQAVEYANRNNFEYDASDRRTVLQHASIFHVITDTMMLRYESTNYTNFPIQYDFEDFNGSTKWQNTFVNTALSNRTGNCQSMSYLYKILADEYGIATHFAYAPNHIYIQNNCKQIGTYNTELTNATFPDDAWLMASGYIHIDAVRNGIYLAPITDKEAVAVCLLDLAKGYERKYNLVDNTFSMKCCNTVLHYFPHNIFALLLKAKLLKKTFDKNKDPALYADYEKLIKMIYNLGYRKMPEENYINWLQTLQGNKGKYVNKKLKFKSP